MAKKNQNDNTRFDMGVFVVIVALALVLGSLVLWAIKGFAIDNFFLGVSIILTVVTGAACLSYAFHLFKHQFKTFSYIGTVISALAALLIMAKFAHIHFIPGQGKVTWAFFIAAISLFHVSLLLHGWHFVWKPLVVAGVIIATLVAGYLILDYVINWNPGTQEHKEFGPDAVMAFKYILLADFLISLVILIWGVVYYLFFKERHYEQIPSKTARAYRVAFLMPKNQVQDWKETRRLRKKERKKR